MPSREEKREAIQKHRDARENLARVSSQSTEETDAYLEANSAVIEAEKGVPWYRR